MRDTLASTPTSDYSFHAMPVQVQHLISLAHQTYDAWCTAEAIERDAEVGRRMDAKTITVAAYQVWQQVEELGAPLLAAWEAQWENQ